MTDTTPTRECKVSYDFGLLSLPHERAIEEGLHECQRVTYPVAVRVRDARGFVSPKTLHRVGGGDRSLAEAGDAFYPTVLWHFDGDHRRFDPSRYANAWKTFGAPDTYAPYEVVEVLATWSSDDPLGATKRWPIPQHGEPGDATGDFEHA